MKIIELLEDFQLMAGDLVRHDAHLNSKSNIQYIFVGRKGPAAVIQNRVTKQRKLVPYAELTFVGGNVRKELSESNTEVSKDANGDTIPNVYKNSAPKSKPHKKLKKGFYGVAAAPHAAVPPCDGDGDSDGDTDGDADGDAGGSVGGGASSAGGG